MRENARTFRLGDWLILLAGAALVLWLLLVKIPRHFAGEAKMVRIESPVGEYIYPLTEDRMVVIAENGRRSVVEIAAGRVRMKEDNSPRQLAVNQGWIENPGQWIVNLPHRIFITIEGEVASLDSEAY